MQTLIDFFIIKDLMPHGYFLSWNPALLRLHVISDVLIILSYYSIPLSLAHFIRKRKDLPYAWMIILSTLFIIASGTTHLMSAVIVWVSLYWFDGYLKLFTAIISIMVAIAMFRVIQLALKLPSAEQLQTEINKRKKVERTLQQSEGKFKAIFDKAPLGIGLVNSLTGEFYEANLMLAKIVGRPLEQVSNLDWISITHPAELRPPMNGVISMVEVLQQSKLESYQLEMVNTIRDSGLSLLEITKDILDFSKIEADKLEIECIPTKLAKVVESVCAMLDQMASNK